MLRYNKGCFEEAIELLSRGQIDLDELVTHNWYLRDAAVAFEAVKAQVGIKSVIWSHDVLV